VWCSYNATGSFPQGKPRLSCTVAANKIYTISQFNFGPIAGRPCTVMQVLGGTGFSQASVRITDNNFDNDATCGGNLNGSFFTQIGQNYDLLFKNNMINGESQTFRWETGAGNAVSGIGVNGCATVLDNAIINIQARSASYVGIPPCVMDWRYNFINGWTSSVGGNHPEMMAASVTGYTFAGYISGTTLTVTTAAGGNANYLLAPGTVLSTSGGVTSDTQIVSQTSGTFGLTGVYEVSIGQTVGSSGTPVTMGLATSCQGGFRANYNTLAVPTQNAASTSVFATGLGGGVNSTICGPWEMNNNMFLTNTSGGATPFVGQVTGFVGTDATHPTSVVTVTSVGSGTVGNMQTFALTFTLTGKIDDGSGGPGNIFTVVGTPPAGDVVGLGASANASGNCAIASPIILSQTSGTTGSSGTYTISGAAQVVPQKTMTVCEAFVLGPQITSTAPGGALGGAGTYHADNWYAPYAFYDLNTNWPAFGGGSGWGEYATFSNWGTNGLASQGGLANIGIFITGPFSAVNNYIDMGATLTPFKTDGLHTYAIGGFAVSGNLDMMGVAPSSLMNPGPF
jgi:hypothetical protein